MAAVDVEPRAVQVIRAMPMLLRRWRVSDLVEQAGNVSLDDFQRRHDLGDPPPDQILEIAGLENADDEIRDILRRALLDLALERSPKVICQLIDLFGGGKDFLRRLIGAGGN